MSASRARKMPQCGGGYWVVPPHGRNERLSRLFGRLELAWDLGVFGLLAVSVLVQAVGRGARAVDAATGAIQIASAALLAEVLTKWAWHKNVFGVLSYYYREWLEPADAPRFAARAMAHHPHAVGVLLATFLLNVNGCLVGLGAVAAAVKGYAGVWPWLAAGAVGCFAGSVALILWRPTGGGDS